MSTCALAALHGMSNRSPVSQRMTPFSFGTLLKLMENELLLCELFPVCLVLEITTKYLLETDCQLHKMHNLLFARGQRMEVSVEIIIVLEENISLHIEV